MPGPDAAARLLALPPSRFVAERTALAKALADRGDPSAAAVRKLRRPTGLAWVMNRLARDRRRDVDALLAAGDRLAAGQRRVLAGGGADALRAADAELRDRARALRLAAGEIMAEEGRPAAGAALARLELLLRAAATAPGEAREALREGRLEREPEVAAGDLSGFGVVAGGGAPARARPAPAPPARPRGARRPDRGAGREAARQVREGARAERASAARAEREARARARREEKAHERARKLAAAALARARVAARKAAGAAERAEAVARRARAEADAAAERARALRARADAAREEATRREAALRDAGGAAS